MTRTQVSNSADGDNKSFQTGTSSASIIECDPPLSATSSVDSCYSRPMHTSTAKGMDTATETTPGSSFLPWRSYLAMISSDRQERALLDNIATLLSLRPTTELEEVVIRHCMEDLQCELEFLTSKRGDLGLKERTVSIEKSLGSELH
jgi:hypothetical protein